MYIVYVKCKVYVKWYRPMYKSLLYNVNVFCMVKMINIDINVYRWKWLIYVYIVIQLDVL